jgi:hypothetical protein
MVIALLALAFSACGQSQAVARGAPATSAPARTPQATSSATASSHIPYSFTAAWHPPTGAALHINNFVFSASTPSTGYACATGYPAPASGPSLLVTKDGGASWAPAGAYPMGAAVCQVFGDPTDSNDVFIVEPSNYAGFTQGQATYTPVARRSRDGGVTWKAMTVVTLKQIRAGISNLAVIGGRIVASVVPADPNIGTFQDDLVASDDGGVTWQRIGLSMTTVGAVGVLFTEGGVLFTSVLPACASCKYPDMSLPLTGTSSTTHPPLISNASSFYTDTYYRSTDLGATWTKVAGMPANANVSGLSFAPSQFHAGQYVGVAIAQIQGATGIQASLLYSLDTGATWRSLLSFQGVGNGWPDPNSLGQYGQLTVLPNEAVFAGTAHTVPGQGQGADAGIFRLGLESSGEWQPIAPNSVSGADGSTGFVGQWQVVPNGSGWRIWGVAYGTALSSGLSCLDVS